MAKYAASKYYLKIPLVNVIPKEDFIELIKDVSKALEPLDKKWRYKVTYTAKREKNGKPQQREADFSILGAIEMIESSLVMEEDRYA